MASKLTGHVTHWACLGCSGYETHTIHIQQRVPVPDNIQQLHTAIEEKWTIIPQATINNLINSMWKWCVAQQIVTGFLTPLASLRHTCAIIIICLVSILICHTCEVGWIILAKEKCFRKVWEWYLREMVFCVNRKYLRSLSSTRERWEQKQKCCFYIFAQCNSRGQILYKNISF